MDENCGTVACLLLMRSCGSVHIRLSSCEGAFTWISCIWRLSPYFFCCPAGSSRRWSDCEEVVTMNVMYVLGGLLSVGLLVYLMVALLKAEWF